MAGAPKRPPNRPTEAPDTSDRRAAVLRLLQDAEQPVTIAAIATELQVHPNTVRFHLDTLIEQGRAERSPSGPADGPGRPAARFRAARVMDPAGRREYRVLAEILVAGVSSGPDPAAEAARAGRRWGSMLAARSAEQPAAPPTATEGRSEETSIGRLVTLLDDLGFAPEYSETADSEHIGLRSCPFLELARDHAEVTCPVHLGIMQGALEAWDDARTVERLDPFVEPDLCLAHLATATPPASRS